MKRDYRARVKSFIILLVSCLTVSAVSCAQESVSLKESKSVSHSSTSEETTALSSKMQAIDPADKDTQQAAIVQIESRMQAFQEENPEQYSKIECYDFSFFTDEKTVDAAHFQRNWDFSEHVKAGKSYLYVIVLMEGFYSDQYMRSAGEDGAFQGPKLAAFLLNMDTAGQMSIVAESIHLKLGMQYPHER